MSKLKDKDNLRQKQSSLETANEMFKNAFQLKKMKFYQENSKLSDDELNIMTANYFKSLNKAKA